MRTAAALIAGGLVVGACGESDVVTEGGIEILTHSSDDAMTALSSFTLMLDPDGACLYHDEPDNNGEPGTGGRVVIVWPEGFQAEPVGPTDARILDADGNEVARTGEPVVLGGGAVGDADGHCGAIGAWITSEVIGSPDS